MLPFAISPTIPPKLYGPSASALFVQCSITLSSAVPQIVPLALDLLPATLPEMICMFVSVAFSMRPKSPESWVAFSGLIKIFEISCPLPSNSP